MDTLLVSFGVESARLTMETEATNTVENLLNVAATLKTTRSWVVSMTGIPRVRSPNNSTERLWPSRRPVRIHQRLRNYTAKRRRSISISCELGYPTEQCSARHQVSGINPRGSQCTCH